MKTLKDFLWLCHAVPSAILITMFMVIGFLLWLPVVGLICGKNAAQDYFESRGGAVK
jgi:hypothetical protein